jgi:hypothetical protein
MRFSRHLSGPLAVAVGLLGLLSACTASVSSSGSYDEGWGGSTTTTSDAGVITGDGAPSTEVMLAKIDPNASMTQMPGQGVGVFAQYDTTSDADPGGHWYIWWTCDTSLSGESCPFTITATVAHGVISNATSQGFAPSDQLLTPANANQVAADSVTAETLTTTQVQGVHFDAPPGEVLTLSAELGGEYSGSFIFFVEDGTIRGGYTGELTDPIDLQSTVP